MANRPAFPPVPITVDADAYGGFRLRALPTSFLDGTIPNWLLCSACRLVDEGKRIVCKGKQPEPRDIGPQTCEFERIEDFPFASEPGVFPGEELERADSGLPTDSGEPTPESPAEPE